MGKYCFGVDVGGTTVKLGLFNTNGDLLEKWEIPTVTEDNGKAILPDCAKSILKKMDEREMDRTEVVGVGIGAPGPIDSEGTLYGAVNLGWGTMSLKKELQTLLNMPVEAGNDANVAALGEAWQGGAKGYEDVVVVTLGTGVGGGIIINGKMVAGATGAAGEIGHMHVNDDETEPCNCGNCGCLEEYVSATGIVRMAKRKLAEDDRPSIMRKDDLSAKDVWDAVKAGDTVAIEVAEDFGWYLGKAMALVANVSNPEIFVIGGGVSKAGNVLLDYILRPLADRKDASDWAELYKPWWTDEYYNKANVLMYYEAAEEKQEEEALAADYFKDAVEENLQKNIFPYIEAHPETEFYIFYPPYSILFWNDVTREKELEAVIGRLEYMTERLLNYENVHVFNFLGKEDIICNLNNYADYMHYHKNVCRYITECFATGENELHPENYGQAFDEIRTLAMSYNYPAIWDDWYDMTPRYGEE